MMQLHTQLKDVLDSYIKGNHNSTYDDKYWVSDVLDSDIYMVITML